MSDLIDRQQAIDALHMHLMYRMGTDSNKKRLDDWINGLPSAQETHEKRTETHACDLISRQAAIDALDEIESEVADGYGYQYEKWRKYFCGLPPAQPERPKGKWNTYYHSDTEFTYSCNSCGYSAPYQVLGGEVVQKKWNFCPNCGADMRGDTYE